MSLVPADFELSYNGYRFDPEYTETTGIQIRAVPDKAGRTTIYNEYTLTFRTWVLGYATDQKVEDIRRRLLRCGAALVYSGRALGDLRLNTTSRKDVNYGPVPREVGVKFIGQKKATQIDWQVVVHMPDCKDAKYQFTGLDLSYTVEHRLRRNGRVDRTIAGELRIANNRTAPGSRQILDSPDMWREDVAAPLTKYFRREWAPWKVNEARTVLNFGWTDFEFEHHVYPPGIAWCDADHEVTSNERGLVQWTATINGEYEVAAGYPPATAEKAFAMLCKERIDNARKGKNARGDNINVIALSFRARESGIYSSEKAHFQLSYMVIGSTLKDIVTNSGMWLAGRDEWDQWYASLKDSGLNPYGYSGLRFRPGDDLIVDACGGEVEEVAPAGKLLGGELKGIFPAYPNAEGSWIEYENTVYVEADSGLATFRDMGSDPPKTIEGGTLVSGFATTLKAPTAPPVAGPIDDGSKYAKTMRIIREKVAQSKALSPTMQGNNDFGRVAPVPTTGDGTGKSGSVQRSGSLTYVFMKGRALRVGYDIPCPELADVEGEKPTLDNRLDQGEGFKSGIVGNAGVPVYGAVWNLRYFLQKVPSKPISAPPNPLYDTR